MKISVSGKAAVAASPLINRLRSELQRAELSDGVILRHIVAERRINFVGRFHHGTASPKFISVCATSPVREIRAERDIHALSALRQSVEVVLRQSNP